MLLSSNLPSAIYTTVLGLVSRLNHSETEQLMQDILKIHITSTQGAAKLIAELREKKYSEGFVYPHCGSIHFIRLGKFFGCFSGDLVLLAAQTVGITPEDGGFSVHLKEILHTSCHHGIKETYKTLRLAEFKVTLDRGSF